MERSHEEVAYQKVSGADAVARLLQARDAYALVSAVDCFVGQRRGVEKLWETCGQTVCLP
jgi:hypothetical protein